MSAKTDWLNPGFWFLPLTHTFVLGPLRAGSPGSFLPGWRRTQHLAAWLAQSRHPWNPEPSSLVLSWWLSKGQSPSNGVRRKMRKRPDIPASQGVSREPPPPGCASLGPRQRCFSYPACLGAASYTYRPPSQNHSHGGDSQVSLWVVTVTARLSSVVV